MTTTPSKRAPYARSTERKLQIAAAALEVVDELGYGKVSAQAVSQRSGIAESTINYQFPTRAHLLVGALELSDRQHQERLQQRYAGSAPLASDLVFDIAEGDVRELSRLRLFHYLLGEAVDVEHPANAYIVARHSRSVAWLAQMVEGRQLAGQAHPDLDPQLTARQILSSWIGLEAMWLLDPSFDFTHSVEAVVRQLTRQDAMEARQAIEQLAAQF